MDQSGQSSAKRIELRQHRRCAVPPTCLLSFARFALSITFSGDAEGEGAVINLSLKGCKVDSDAGVKVGDAMSLILLLPGGEPPTTVDLALVRWVQGPCFGLEFVSIGSAEVTRLRRFLTSVDLSEQ